MAKPLRILHLADSHIGADMPARPRLDRPRRGDDLVASYRRVLSHAWELEVDLVIHAGDVFNRSRPNDAALAAATAPLLELAAAGIQVVIVPGNHERSTLPAALLLSHRNIHVIDRPRTLSFRLGGHRVAVAALPFIRTNAAERFTEALCQTQWQKARADFNLLAVHQTFESATCGPVAYRFRSGEDVVERDAVPVDFDYVAAGHIHRHQVLATLQDGGPPIVYAGSPDRISFAERDEPKGCMLIEVRAGQLTSRFLEHVTRPMSLLPLDVSGMTRSQIRALVEEALNSVDPDAVAMLRLSGQSTPLVLRGLDLTRRGRALRPDVLLTVSSQAVELVPEREARRQDGSVFSDLLLAGEQLVSLPVGERKLLPASRGVYALYDTAGRLLYIGKAKHIRTRVGSHLNGTGPSSFFNGWTRQIARIETRTAHSELEALLVEADLIGRLRPPFNRRMRNWSRYCYLAENGLAFRQLSLCSEPASGDRCVGPFRSRALAEQVLDTASAVFGVALCPEDWRATPGSRGQVPNPGLLCGRYFEGHCSGPCAGRVSDTGYGERLRKRDGLLLGLDDSVIAAWEREAESKSGDTVDHQANRFEASRTFVMRMAFDQLALIHEAEKLMGGLLLLPGGSGQRKLAVFTRPGVHLDTLDESIGDGERVLNLYRRLTDGRYGLPTRRLPKPVVDCFCTAARALRHGGGSYVFIPADKARALDARGLLAEAFASTNSTC